MADGLPRVDSSAALAVVCMQGNGFINSACKAQMQDMMRLRMFAGGGRIAHNELHRLLAAHCNRGGDLLIPPDGECAHCVAGLAKHRLLSCELL